METESGELAILIKTVDAAAMLRRPSRRGGYFWRDTTSLRRRRDLDGNPDPEWLAQARVSKRPPACLWWLLGLVPAPPDTLVPEPNAGIPAHDFDTDADGRPR